MLQLRRSIVQVNGLFRWRPTGKQTLVLVGIMGLLLIVSILIGGYYSSWTWTGFGEYTGNLPINSRAKTLWDWMQLLIVPAVLAGGAYLLNQLNTRTQNEIEDNSQRESALQTYIDRMSELLLDKGLRDSKEDSEIRKVAQTRTLAVLRRLDRDRKGILVQFLQEAKLISKIDASQSETIIISLRDVDLSGANLSHAILNGADLRRANLSIAKLTHAKLRGANLDNADLRGANLYFADLTSATLNIAHLNGANLSGATLNNAHLNNAHLIHTDLGGANLSRAELSSADLHGANLNIAKVSRATLYCADLRGADLRGADLSGADLRNAKISHEQLRSAKSLEGTTLPDGSKHP